VGCDCDRYIEVWNLVFSQFNNDGQNNYTELPQKNIDTGMGLERLAVVCQDVDSLFDVDTVMNITHKVSEITGAHYGETYEKDVSLRIITDHIRSSTFMTCDGVLPSNEGRGYVLRRLLRRAARHGRLLGVKEPFLYKVCATVIQENKGAYPELAERQEYITSVIRSEEENFARTIDGGLSIFAGMLSAHQAKGESVFSGADAFKLYDTYGFPPDLTREIAAERGFEINEERFTALMKEQRERARAARGNVGGWSGESKSLIAGLPATGFTGYSEYESDVKVVAIFADGAPVEEISEGEFTLVTDRTPFYGEGGGQVGDSGTFTAGGALAVVTDTKKTDGVYLHECTLDHGIIRVGDGLRASVDRVRRDAIRRNHSSLHLLQAALREVLGSHVEQAGSYVDEHRGRFDFSHFSAVTRDELDRVEKIINSHVLAGEPVVTLETDIESAKKMGAMMLFGEKYGKTVRVVTMGDRFSVEFCGGTHVDNTAKIGLVKIVSEASVASGVRRIELVTGLNVLALLHEKEALAAETAAVLKLQNPADLPKKAAAVQAELAAAKKEIEALNAKIAASKLDGLMSGAVAVGSVKLATAALDGTDPDTARALCDRIRDTDPSAVVVLALKNGDRLNFLASAGPAAVKAGVHAGKLIGAVAAVTGGKGGGRPDSAMAGGRDASLSGKALEAAKEVLEGQLK
jgi:alanyl-tRNA synthetase